MERSDDGLWFGILYIEERTRYHVGSSRLSKKVYKFHYDLIVWFSRLDVSILCFRDHLIAWDTNSDNFL